MQRHKHKPIKTRPTQLR